MLPDNRSLIRESNARGNRTADVLPFTHRSLVAVVRRTAPQLTGVQEPAPRTPEAEEPTEGGRDYRRWIASYAGYLVIQFLQLVALFKLAPRFFWYDDAARQFAPMAWWLGRNMRGGKPPLMDPDLGMAGNLTADMQYGVLDPLHWVSQAIMGRFDDLVAMSWFYGTFAVAVLGTGTLALLLHYRVRGAWAVAGAIGAASSGFFLWYGSSWWPLLWSTAWLPWLWFGLASRRWPGALAAGVATWAIFASGNPYGFPFAALIVVGQVWELKLDPIERPVFKNPHFLSRLAVCAGGGIAALPGLLTTVQISSLMGREGADDIIGNRGFGVTNLADALLGSPTLIGNTNSWGGNLPLVPAMATMLLALPLLAFVDWRRAIRARGVRTSLLVFGVAVVLTQLPTTVGPLRYPLRYLVNLQLVLPILALVAVTAAPLFDRRRLGFAGVVLEAQFALAVFRAPYLSVWHFAALALGAVALFTAAFVYGDRKRKSVPAALAAAGPLICVTLAPLLGAGMMLAVQQRIFTLDAREAAELGAPPGEGSDWSKDVDVDAAPFRPLYSAYQLDSTVAGYRSRSYATDDAMTVIPFDFGQETGWHEGVVGGNGLLIAGLKPGFGSLAVWHKAINEHWCRDYVGRTCATPGELLAPVEGTSRPWIDVMSADTVVLQTAAPAEVTQYFERNWERSFSSGEWVEYGRRETLPGRVAEVEGVTVSDRGWSTQPAYLGTPMDRYRVTTEDGGWLLFRIPFWPGITAYADGKPVEVSSVDRSLLKVDLPGGLSGARLDIFYEPVGAKIVILAPVLGMLVVLAGAFAVPRVMRRFGNGR
jgi:hypothetical protein